MTTPGRLERVVVSTDGKGFQLDPSRRAFVPWGFNYDHDDAGRLLEEYWLSEWSRVAEDFHEMKLLGANVIRVHLQLGAFMKQPDEPDRAALRQLARLVQLAERENIYLDVTGLGCYLKAGVPAWLDALSESRRWAVQERFWEEVARVCAGSAAIFCYNLINEPVVPGERRKPGDWLGPPFAGRYHFVQFVALDPAGRKREDIGRSWVQTLVAAIRKHDRHHLVTVGFLPTTQAGFAPLELASELDFLSVHLYPAAGKVEECVRTLAEFRVGRPVVVEEMFPLHCGVSELRQFITASAAYAGGWIGFYWGRTIAESRERKTMRDALMVGWLELFAEGPPAQAGCADR